MIDNKPQTGLPVLDKLLGIHQQLVYRNNISSNTILNMANLDKDYFTSVAAALLTLGTIHAPIVQTVSLLRDVNYEQTVESILSSPGSGKVPGWGSDFVKGESDPIFDEIDQCISNHEVYDKILHITELLHDNNKIIYPNAACYTAACSIIIKLPDAIAPYLLIKGRLEGWTDVYLKSKTAGSDSSAG